MRTNLVNLLRLAIVVAVLGFAIAPAALAQRSDAPRGTVSTASGSGSRSGRSAGPQSGEQPDEPPGDPVAGVVWIAGVIVVLVFLAWLALRIGDRHQGSDLPA
jgi:hypothetical protein